MTRRPQNDKDDLGSKLADEFSEEVEELAAVIEESQAEIDAEKKGQEESGKKADGA